MARRRRHAVHVRQERVRERSRVPWVIGVLVLAGLSALAWSHRQRLGAWLGLGRDAEVVEAPLVRIDPANDGRRIRVAGRLASAEPARDPQLGVSADAALLFRDVEMYAWREQCKGLDCRYDLEWSAHPADSRRFRQPHGHANPPLPFASATFAADGLRLGAYAIDADVLAAQSPTPDALAVWSEVLPPNLAAVFHAEDGKLYAGGDASQPVAGTIRVGYRQVPLGEVSLTGVQHGNRLSAH